MNRNPWLEYACEDIKAAEVLHERKLYRLSSFHAQQCVEKTLKGILWHLGINPPRTHDLVFLYEKVTERYPHFRFDLEALEFLNGLYIESRYPADLGLLPEGEPTDCDSRKTITIAREILHAALQLLPNP